jgi:hypothetical protein
VTTGTALPQPAETTLTAVLVLATAVWVGGMVAIFVVARVARATLGMAQARRMTRLRQDALRDPGSLKLTAKVRRGARNATVLRAAIAALSLALLALGTVIAT